MRIRMLKTCIVSGHRDPVRHGAVIESDEAHVVKEFKALVGVGYAVETKDAVTNTNKPSAPKNDSEPMRDPLDIILDGTVPEIEKQLESLTERQLVLLREREEARDKPRVGVIEAINEYDLEEAEAELAQERAADGDNE